MRQTTSDHRRRHSGRHRSTTATLAVAILAGGDSRRFGSDKAAATFAGRPMLASVVDRATAVSERVMIVGRESVPDGIAGDGLFLVPDREPGLGPLGGLHSALVAADAPLLVMACDMPAISLGLLHWMIAIWRSGPLGSGVLPVVERRPQPCMAIYPRQTRTPCRQALGRGERSLSSIARPGLMRSITVPDELAWRFDNCNTPEALARLEHHLAHGGEVRA